MIITKGTSWPHSHLSFLVLDTTFFLEHTVLPWLFAYRESSQRPPHQRPSTGTASLGFETPDQQGKYFCLLYKHLSMYATLPKAWRWKCGTFIVINTNAGLNNKSEIWQLSLVIFSHDLYLAVPKGLRKCLTRFLGSEPMGPVLEDDLELLSLHYPHRKHEHKYFYSTGLFRSSVSWFILSA